MSQWVTKVVRFDDDDRLNFFNWATGIPYYDRYEAQLITTTKLNLSIIGSVAYLPLLF